MSNGKLPPFATAARLVRWQNLLTILLLAGTVVAAYGQVCGFDFVDWDDTLNVYQNPFLHPVNLAHILRFWQSGYFELYMPVTYTFWSLLAWIAPPHEPIVGAHGSLSGTVFHAGSLFLHVVNTLMVWRFLRFLLLRASIGLPSKNENNPAAWDGASIAGAAGALLFGLHPLMVESIAWVTGANNVLSAFFVLIALRLYLAARTPGNGTGTAHKPGLFLTLATVAYVLALLSKPMAASTALTAVLLDWGTRPRENGDRPAAARFRWGAWQTLGVPALWVLLAGADAVVTRLSSKASQTVVLPYLWRPIIALDALWFYATKLLIPLDLCIDYGHLPALVVHHGWGYATAAASLVAGYAIYRSHNRVLQTATLIAVSALLPALGIVPFYLHRWSTVGDRYMYLAMIGPALAIAYGWQQIAFPPTGPKLWPPRLRQIAAIAYAGLVVFWAVESALLTATWGSTHRLFTHILAITPHSRLATAKLGEALENEGKPDEAVEQFYRAAQLMPGYAPVCYDLGSLLIRRGQIDEGIVFLQQAVKIDPTDTEIYDNLGLALAQKGRWPEAIAAFQTLVEQEKSDRARAKLAAAIAAAKQFPRGYPLPPPDQDPDALGPEADGIARAQRGDLSGAVLAFRRAIRVRPDFGRPFFEVGVTLDRQGNFAEACAAYQSALVRDPHRAEAYFNLGVDFARLGRNNEAAAVWRAALAERPGWELPRRALQALPPLSPATNAAPSPLSPSPAP